MLLQVNGETKELTDASNLQAALDSLGYEGTSFAVALNGDFVPRSNYSETTLQDGDQLEVLFPMRGG